MKLCKNANDLNTKLSPLDQLPVNNENAAIQNNALRAPSLPLITLRIILNPQQQLHKQKSKPIPKQKRKAEKIKISSTDRLLRK